MLGLSTMGKFSHTLVLWLGNVFEKALVAAFRSHDEQHICLETCLNINFISLFADIMRLMLQGHFWHHEVIVNVAGISFFSSKHNKEKYSRNTEHMLTHQAELIYQVYCFGIQNTKPQRFRKRSQL